MSGESQYGNIYLTGRSRTKGSLVIASDEIRWKASASTKLVTIPISDISELRWTPVSQNYQMKVVLNSGTEVRFQGFRRSDKEALDSFANSVTGKALDIEELATNGWNWGSFQFKSSTMKFSVDDKLAFEIPFSDVSQSVVQGKNEVGLEFHQDDTVQADEECLVEMRLYIPPNFKVGDEEEEEELEVPEGAEGTPGEPRPKKSAVEKFHSEVLDRAQLGEHDESISSFENVLFITPRGRYDLEMFGTYFKLHGKSYSYKILYKSVNRLFMLPRPSGQTTFVVSLDPAIRQGNTSYPFLQLTFRDEDEIELKPNMGEDALKKKFDGKLTSTMTGTYSDVLGKVFAALTNRKINAPGAFKNSIGERCVRCSHRAFDGMIFPLERSLFFIHKPPVYIRHEDISSVEFLRIGASSSGSTAKTFDILLNLKQENLSFTSLNREEYSVMVEYFQSRKLKVVGVNEPVAKSSDAKPTVTRSGRMSVKGKDGGVVLPDMDDEDSEEDEDFAEENNDETDEDEYSEDDEDGDGQGGDNPDEKKKAKKKEKSSSSSSEKKEKKDKKPKSDRPATSDAEKVSGKKRKSSTSEDADAEDQEQPAKKSPKLDEE
eukprot:TRINITY_DN27793_c0_g1_i1.p1 TRINITY_DN27793_c0_g1~~TRINITY_DN27793_c0_g1_i1.p1  ORF type:complete len:617 (-),score=208.68 TRINITY_DN27793_c0_g1_i1:858-2663(-)